MPSAALLTVVDKPLWLLDAPEPKVAPPVVTRRQLLPFGELSWQDFERLCLRLARLDGDPEYWQLYGTAGQSQGGIDILVRQAAPDGYVVWQSKRHRTFSPAKVKQAVDKFLAGSWAQRSTRFVLCTSASLTETDVAEAIEAQAARLREKNIVFDTRDEAKLSEAMKDHSDLVDDFFGRGWVTAFCGDDAASKLGERLDGHEFSDLKQRLGRLYAEHFAAVDPGVIRATAATTVALRPPLALAARFIPPDLVSSAEEGSEGWTTTVIQAPTENTKSGSSWFADPSAPSIILTKRRDPRTVSLETWSRALDRAVVVGPPGAGKSTLLRFLALDMLSDSPRLGGLREQFPAALPVWISFPFWTRQIKRVQAGAPVSVQGVVTAWLEAHGEPELVPLLLRAIEDQRTLLLVDGIDEWVDESSAATAVTLLQTFVGVRKLPVVVTSRPYGARLLASLDATWARFEMAPFSITQQVDFVSAWLQHLLPAPADLTAAPARARERAETLVADIHRSPQIVPLAEVPLLLAGLLALSISGAALPRSRYRSYRELCSRMLESHPLARGRAAMAAEQADDLDPATREKVLAGLAYAVQADSTSDSSPDAIRLGAARQICHNLLVADLALQPHDAEARARRLLAVGEEALGILVRKSPEEIGFLHRAFQEFLAAQHITGLSLDEQVAIMGVRATDPRWRDVLLFVVEAAARATEVQILVETLEAARDAATPADWSATLLLADITFSDARRPIALTRRLTESFCELVETGPDLSERAEILRRVVAGLSNEQTANLVRPRLSTWFPAWSDFNRRGAIELIAAWPEDPAVDQVLWRVLQDDDANLRMKAATGLAARCAGNDDWRARILKLGQTTSAPGVAAAAVWALANGWPNTPSTKAAVDACAEADDPVLFLIGIRARVVLGDVRDADCDRVLEQVTGREWVALDDFLAVLTLGWSGNETVKQILLSAHRNGEGNGQAVLRALAAMYPQDDEVARQLRQDLPDRFDGWDRHEFFNVLARNFRGHPEMATLVDTWAQERNQTYELAHAAAIFPTPALKAALTATLKKPEHLIFWTVDALLDLWGMDDPDIASALRRVADWDLETMSDVADRLPEILGAEAAKPLLRQMVSEAATNIRIRGDMALKGLKAIDAIDEDSSIVGDILKMDLFGDFFVNSLTAMRLIEAAPNDPRVVAFALNALRHADGLISVITLLMGHHEPVRKAILEVVAPLPAPLRVVLTPLLQTRAVDDPFARDLLATGQDEVAQSVVVASAIATARTRVARDELTPQYKAYLGRELRAIGPRMDGRRLGAFTASIIAGWPQLAADVIAEETFYHLRMTDRLQENRLACEALAANWNRVEQAFSIEQIQEALSLEPGQFIEHFSEYADRAPSLRKALEIVDAQAWAAGKQTSASLRFMATNQPKSRSLMDRCLMVIAGHGDNWTTRQMELTAAELLANAFTGDPGVLDELARMLEHGLWSGPLAALCDGWPDSDLLEEIFQKLVNDPEQHQRHLDHASILKVVATKSKCAAVLRNLGAAATEMRGGYWDAIPFWLPTMSRRIRGDDEVAAALMSQLSSDASVPPVRMSFASLLAGSRGIGGELSAWCRQELRKSQDAPISPFAFDVWMGATVPVRSRLLELLRDEA